MAGNGDFLCNALLSRICLSLLVNVEADEDGRVGFVGDEMDLSGDTNGTTDISG